MSRKTEISTAAAALVCAMAIGFVMQSGDVAELRYGTFQPEALSPTPVIGKKVDPTDIQPEPAAFLLDDSDLSVNSITLTSARIEAFAPMPAPAKPQPASLEKEFDLPTSVALQEPYCPVSATATPGAAAMVRLSLNAPCLPNEQVSVTHEGMSFLEVTSLEGRLDIDVPTLAEDAVFQLAFPNGESVEVEAEVPGIALYDRIVVQWSGEPGIQIHAREFGADYGDEGHVWVGAPRDLTAVVEGQGGFLTRHGNPGATVPMIAEVYTFPAAITKASGAVNLSIETEVTAQNCGTEVAAQAFEVSPGASGIGTRDLLLSMPDCSAVGNFLVLNNLLQDLKIARN